VAPLFQAEKKQTIIDLKIVPTTTQK